MKKATIYAAIEAYCRKHGLSRWQPKAALIDMDGTLIDSMRNHTAAWKRLSDDLGLGAERDEFYLYEGMTGRATIRRLFQRAKGVEPSDEKCDELYKIKTRYFNELPRVATIPGADRMLKMLMDNDITRVLVTGSKQLSNLDRLDTDFPGAFPHDLRITASDVSHGKPHPEPYLKGMQLGMVSAVESIVIENAPLGVESGAASGAFTLAAATGPIPIETLKEAGADLVFESMEELADALPVMLKQNF
jgi:beta-phosphoglucomutase-like phosphatase (HAD superfamily)